MGTNSNRDKPIEELCFHIFESEEKDFEENPSDSHPYYIALCISKSESYAKEYLTKTIEERSDAC